jgi:hypothetical protein
MLQSTVIRHGLISVSIGSAVAAALLGLAGTASAAEPQHPMVLAAQSSTFNVPVSLSPSFCLFGKHKHGKGCNGGSELKATANMYKSAGECAVQGVGEGIASGDPVAGSYAGAAVCGMEHGGH